MNRLLLWINILLVAASAYFAVRVVYTATRPLPGLPRPRVQPAAPVPAGPATGQLGPISAYRAIAERDLFKAGKVPENKKPSVDVDTLARTRLKLKLWGTIAGPADQTRAVIETPKMRRQHLYRIGDTIENATVKMILREKVVLHVDGRDEVLMIEKNSKSATGGRATARPAVPAHLPAAPAPAPARRIALKKEILEQALAKNDDLGKQIRASPHMEGGQPAGVRISGIRPDSVFRKMGLRSGDILVGMNDTPLESPEGLGTVIERLGASDSASLQIKRKGRPTVLEIAIE